MHQKTVTANLFHSHGAAPLNIRLIVTGLVSKSPTFALPDGRIISWTA